MSTHEHFEELCALAVIGQLAEQEHQEFLEHLNHCDLCRRASGEFAFILDQLPAASPPDISGGIEELLSESYRQKFLQRASEEGLRFTSEVDIGRRPLLPRRSVRNKYPVWSLATALVCLPVLALLFAFPGVRGSIREAIRKHFVTESVIVNPAPHRDNSVQQPEVRRPTPAVADAELVHRIDALRKQLVQVSQEKARIQEESTFLKQEIAVLSSQRDKGEQASSELNAQIERVKSDRDQIIATLVENENRNQELSSELGDKTAALERERQLNAAAKAVRELMGARNLHMTDVYDFDTRGKRDRSFGRVLYAKGKPMIFYAFDLGEKGPASKVTFQAWGQEAGGATTAKNLGVFYIEDHAQKRWVLCVEDPKIVSSIDSVFVTVERSPGRDKPSGKKLLYAYLGADANHP